MIGQFESDAPLTGVDSDRKANQYRPSLILVISRRLLLVLSILLFIQEIVISYEAILIALLISEHMTSFIGGIAWPGMSQSTQKETSRTGV